MIYNQIKYHHSICIYRSFDTDSRGTMILLDGASLGCLVPTGCYSQTYGGLDRNKIDIAFCELG